MPMSIKSRKTCQVHLVELFGWVLPKVGIPHMSHSMAWSMTPTVPLKSALLSTIQLHGIGLFGISTKWS